MLVTSLLWINENPHNFRRWKFLLTWIIVLLMDVDSRIWWLGENALTVDQESKWYRFCRGWCASNLSPLDKWEPSTISEDGNFYLLELLYYSWMLTAEFDDLVKHPLIKNPNGTDFVEDDVLVTSLLWINENPPKFQKSWKFLLTWIIVLQSWMYVDSRIW